MVKIHPQNANVNPPPPNRRQRPPSHCFYAAAQLCACLSVALCFLLIVTLVLFSAVVFGGSRRDVLVRVAGASLARFDVNDTSLLLSYDLALNVTVQNPNNRRIGVYYDRAEASAIYADTVIAAASLSPFFQRRKSSNTWSVVFRGSRILNESEGLGFVSKFGEEEREGVFSIVTVIVVSARVKYGAIKYSHNATSIECDLRVPLIGKSSYAFKAKDCSAFHLITYDNN